MAPNPCCCGISLQCGSKTIAVLEIIGSVVILITSIIGFAAYGVYASSEEKKKQEGSGVLTPESEIAVLVILSLLLASSIVSLVLAVVLWQGARDKNIKKCRIWVIVGTVFLVILVANFIVECINVKTGQALRLTQSGVQILIHAYFVFVVHCFVKQVKEEQAAADAA